MHPNGRDHHHDHHNHTDLHPIKEQVEGIGMQSIRCSVICNTNLLSPLHMFIFYFFSYFLSPRREKIISWRMYLPNFKQILRYSFFKVVLHAHRTSHFSDDLVH